MYFIPNPFTMEQQKYWIKKCIQEYTLGNPTNISNLNKTPLWKEWKIDLMSDLRWAALGYHFQWTPRIYTEEHRGVFPAELAEIASDLAGLVNQKIISEAAIVNFYPDLKCQMGAHVDDAEEEMSRPIVSMSFGNSVVFMMGGRTRDVVPTPIFIRSGDVVIMSGESRFCFHSVPRMIANTVPQQLMEPEETDSSWKECQEYMKNARININCRQVKKLTC
uniref:Fe2OG dioxygenase domain-containing protein n=1 Tax=Arcella intermedia TaxID=1963864 RepID=A0A6B2LCC8_9EUKA